MKKARKTPFSVNRNDSRSLADQVADGLRTAIVGGYYAPGDLLPRDVSTIPSGSIRSGVLPGREGWMALQSE